MYVCGVIVLEEGAVDQIKPSRTPPINRMDVVAEAKARSPREALLSRNSAASQSQTTVRDTLERCAEPNQDVDEVDFGDCDDGSGVTRPSTGQEKWPENNRSTIEEGFLRARHNAATVQNSEDFGILQYSEPEDGNVLLMQTRTRAVSASLNNPDTNLPPVRCNPTLSRQDARLVANKVAGWDLHHSLGLPLDHGLRVTRALGVQRQAVLRISSSYDSNIQYGCPQTPRHRTQGQPVSLRAIHNWSVGQDFVENNTAESRELSYTSEV